jgi:hypothetical protein
LEAATEAIVLNKALLVSGSDTLQTPMARKRRAIPNASLIFPVEIWEHIIRLATLEHEMVHILSDSPVQRTLEGQTVLDKREGYWPWLRDKDSNSKVCKT